MPIELLLLLLLPAAVVLTLAVLFFLQYRITIMDYDEYFPIRQAEPAAIERRKDDRIILNWDEDLHPVHITLHASPHSDQALEEWSPEPGQTQVEARASRQRFRPFFHLQLADGRSLLVSTRFQPFEHVRNFRDLGGYLTESGRQASWGLLYRSGQMGKPTPADLQLLQTLQVKTIIDLRDDNEVDRLPDHIPAPLQYRRVFITDSVMVRRLSVLLRRQRLPREFSESYKSMIVEGGAQGIGQVFRLIADPGNMPAVIHCTAGKDRAGVVSALILLTLGVPEETVIAEYTQSNHFAEQLILDIERSVRRVRWLGIRKEHFFPIAAAQPRVIESTLAYIKETYGSVRGYLTERAGVSEEDLVRLRRFMQVED